MKTSNFENWFADQVKIGLIDLKLSILPGKGISVDAIKSELLSAEALIRAGFTKPEPRAKSSIPDNVLKLIQGAAL